MRKFYCTVAAVLLLKLISAQQPHIPGHLSGSYESFTQFYQKDSKINAILPQDRVGSNNFLKLDYTYKQFGAGVQFESYLPSIAGFPFNVNESKLINKYFKYTTNNFNVQIGDFYEQFGNGMVFRAWENRQIGINNALEGANVQVTPLPFLKLKAVYGRQRKVFDHANSNVRGADLEIDFSKTNPAAAPAKTRVATGFSYVSRYQVYTGPIDNFPATVKAGSVRLDISGAAASFNAEYTHKGKDPHDFNNQDTTSGKALQLNGSVSKGNLGVNLTIRMLENMNFRGERSAVGVLLPVNFIPALTRQHDYLTTNIYVYNAQANGETGGQLDVFYRFKKGTSLGGKYGSKLALNVSQYNGLKEKDNIFSAGKTVYFRDINLEWQKKWSDKVNTTLLYQNLFYNKSVVEGGLDPDIKTNTVVLNTTIKYAKRRSFRFELQHLATKQDKENWAALLSEFTFAPKWTFYLSDLYNYGKTDVHYIVGGGSYSKGGTRFGLSYGRQRAGLFCAGGVCRFVPASTGFTATLTTTFNN